MRSHDFLSKIFMLHRVCTLWKLRKFTLTEKIFRQITYLVISLVKLLLSRNFCQKCVRENSRNCHTVKHHTVEITEIYSHLEKISSNQLFSNFFSKTVTFTKFLPKKREREFPQFPHCALRV